MLDNIYVLYKIVFFVFFKEYIIKSHQEFYSKYFNLVVCIQQDKECNFLKNKRNCICHKYSNLNRNSYSDSVYIVQPGDTLFYVAWITGNNYLDLAKSNNIKNLNLLKKNQVLKVKRNHKNLSKRIFLCWYKNYLKIRYFFDFKKKHNSFFLKKNNSVFYTVSMAHNTCFSSKEINVKTLCNWHWPTNGSIINTFSEKEGGNKGIDISGVFDQPILATTNGRVVYVGNILKGYGNLVVIKHDNNYFSAYAHNNKILVSERQHVKIGDQIATMGKSGTNEVKLHFEIRYKEHSINPLHLLP